MAKRTPYPRVPEAATNTLAQQAMDAIRAIDTEANKQKQAQTELLQSARESILERLKAFDHQLAQIDKAMTAITGEAASPRESGGRRNLQALRERVAQWMEGRKGQRLNAADLVKEFPDLEGVSISTLLKPLVESGKVRTDASDGAKRLKYFVPEG